jgi:hypothetical protein
MRAAVLYVRTIDNADIELSDQLDSDQEVAYTALRDTLREAQKRLSKSIGDFADTPGVNSIEVGQMKDVSAQTRQIQSICKDICDAYRKAQDADTAGEGEEQRKLIFRGTLQESLLSFAEATGQLDVSLMKMSQTWEIHGQAGTKNTDEPLAVIMPTATVHHEIAESATPSAPTAGANNQALGDISSDGTLCIMFKGGTLELFVNGKSVKSVANNKTPEIQRIPVTVHSGDVFLFRASSPFVYRSLRFAFLASDGSVIFSSKAGNAVIRPQPDPQTAVPNNQFNGTAGQIGRGDNKQNETWEENKLPKGAEWINLPQKGTLYEIAAAVPAVGRH